MEVDIPVLRGRAIYNMSLLRRQLRNDSVRMNAWSAYFVWIRL